MSQFTSMGDGDVSYIPRKKQKVASTETAITTNMSTLTPRQIANIINSLDMNLIEKHFKQNTKNIDPYVICKGVSVESFNKYVGDGEGLRIALRFLYLSDDGRLVIVELPSTQHDTTVEVFSSEFQEATGNWREIGMHGSLRATSEGLQSKETDASFGPLEDTPHRTPAVRAVETWVTLAVEVGRTQTWNSLYAAARWWCQYEGIQYILLLKIDEGITELEYCLYDITELGVLPPPTSYGKVVRDPVGAPVIVTFDMHRILSIPRHFVLPPGVNQTADVDLRGFLNQVVRNFSRRRIA